ncbi:UNVERIFIED_ORG: nitric oxide dioxygenase [Pseudomonas parafulva]|uniref:NO-inducible flavohemoprotein n=1 Tax=Pseudomonas TaxID=286 RepID=UPI000489A261|nr:MULTISPECIES: NO-inducible flavohemoprotein [Pseudomonas]MDP9558727.1 nitric oxide dioxygenase [Pseudomonas parafulva]RDL16058.1 nitric oxide dioxygenase [Pseudomonas sp. LAMO17WK12:I3]RED01531.1 nitric oxide dioxygenase [Pseudomonas sp. URMO17WK12:I10]CRN06909.1 Flavohemoprotein [Pseudomonas sp. URMO17WK12:I11]SOD05225.1 nitric oxide dioxygenase [Pseudomonas sp. URMO17WK12:I9]
MLNAEQRAIIKATVPLLETGGEALTTHFYQMMLNEYPEVRPLFNQAHQASGDQPRALANGVLMYARHIDQLEQLGGLVGQIINKHVALQILPEHYPIVGRCLLRAIEEVLGTDIATAEVIDAWGAAYGQLADILIGAEENLYKQKEEADGGWRGAREFRLARRVEESLEIVSFYFAPVDGKPVLKAEPGQYIGLRLMIDGAEQRRNYSLSALCDGREYRISVKRESDGKVSSYLHDHLRVGDTLELFPPAGDFTLAASDRPLVLISGGVGITPTLAMLEAALPTGRPVHFIHCARNGQVHAFREWLDTQAAQHPQLKRFYCYAEADEAAHADAVGLLNQHLLGEWLPRERDVDAYFLGPKPFMAAVKRQLLALGVPEQQTRYECFGPAASLA